jgi:hypothetical protein
MMVFRQILHQADFCVVGGGMSGLIAAISAARHGARVLLMHDRPVLGGNASSECRVHICGADRHDQVKNMRETGILEELRLENLYRNPNRSFSIWDTILYEKAMQESNLTLLLNCTCQTVKMEQVDQPGTRSGSKGLIASVTGWQLTTQTYHRVEAKIFADCSGDAVLAPLTGALFRLGREGRDEYGESIAPETADDRTMGMTCLFQSREYDTPQPYEPPAWANLYDSCDALPYGKAGHRWWQMGYWWVELGGEHDSIHDTETLRDELLKITFGVWDHIKNRCPNKAEAQNWALDWVQFLPAKRESRRYMGDHVLTQNDIESGGHFDDLVAYGGWTMDDHHPAGFNAVRIGAPATIFHHSPSPYGIPYRSLYSRNIKNLMFAGRDISVTHAAMSSTRVMGTCSSIGQAVGTAAAMAVQKGLFPSEINAHIDELQQELLKDDAYLPWVPQRFINLTMTSELTSSNGNPEKVRDGINRPVGREAHAWVASPGDWITYRFAKPTFVNAVTLLLDSALDRCIQMSFHQKDDQLTAPPDVMPKLFVLEGWIEGNWQILTRQINNYQRLVRIAVGLELGGVRWKLEQTWGAKVTKVFAFYLE